MRPKDADRMANNVDPDQTAPLGTCLSDNLWTLWYSKKNRLSQLVLLEVTINFNWLQSSTLCVCVGKHLHPSPSPHIKLSLFSSMHKHTKYLLLNLILEILFKHFRAIVQARNLVHVYSVYKLFLNWKKKLLLTRAVSWLLGHVPVYNLEPFWSDLALLSCPSSEHHWHCSVKKKLLKEISYPKKKINWMFDKNTCNMLMLSSKYKTWKYIK